MQSFQKKPENRDLNFEKDIKRIAEYVLSF